MKPFEVRRRNGRFDGVAMPVPTSTPGKVGWLGIYRCELNHRWPDGKVERLPSAVGLLNGFNINPPEGCDVLWRARLFEVDASYDESHWLSEDDLTNKRDHFAFSEEEMESLLLSQGLDPSKLRDMGELPYPI
ncbi:MAG: hypothetical protein HY054_07420 [Proteobacteria bacterium]|nr:hypothetical protein [Pseudomonadota bacterium]